MARGRIALHFSETVEGDLPKAAHADLLEVARQETDAEGETSQVLETIEWRAATRYTKTRLSFTPMQGRTRIRVAVDADSVERVTIVLGSVMRVLATLLVGATLSIDTLPEIVGLAAGGMVATYGALQLTWRTLANRAEERGRQLIEAVVNNANGLTRRDSASAERTH